jgi:hypothetical protein
MFLMSTSDMRSQIAAETLYAADANPDVVAYRNASAA